MEQKFSSPLHVVIAAREVNEISSLWPRGLPLAPFFTKNNYHNRWPPGPNNRYPNRLKYFTPLIILARLSLPIVVQAG